MPTNDLPTRPEPTKKPVRDLVAMVLEGSIRIPVFQRDLKWSSKDVLLLFDSIYRGYPVGSMLMWKRPAEPETVRFGSVVVNAGPASDAWWVVDGQQRLTALTAALARARPGEDASDPYAVWFDLENFVFKTPPPKNAPVPDTWVPASALATDARTQAWAWDWPLARESESMRHRLFELGQRVREYEVPITVLSTDDEGTLREVFKRMNRGGHPLEETGVFDALHGRQKGRESGLRGLAERLAGLGWGTLDETKMLQGILAIAGLDITRRLDDQPKKEGASDLLNDGIEHATEATARVIEFLDEACNVPHRRLLPYPVPLVVLTRFFHLFPSPSPRNRTLLRRWVWRGLLSAAHSHSERTLLRRAVAAIVESEEDASTQRLLALVPRQHVNWSVPERFDGRSAQSRIAMLGLASLRPRDLQTGETLALGALLDKADSTELFRHIFTKPTGGLESLPLGPENRLLHPPGPPVLTTLRQLAERGGESELTRLASHGIDQAAATALRDDDLQTFLRRRRERIESAVGAVGHRRAEWDHSDRPSLGSLLEGAA